MPRDPSKPDPNNRKKFMFWDSDKRQADLRIRLQQDGFTQSHFFRAMITGYLEKDENILKFLDEYKGKYITQGQNKRKQIERSYKAGTETKKQFALDENEIEDIFDIISEEFPEL